MMAAWLRSTRFSRLVTTPFLTHWNGDGIASTNAAAGTLFTLGSGQPSTAGTFDGETVSTSDVEVVTPTTATPPSTVTSMAVTTPGSTTALSITWTGFSNGDFNYDGVIDGSDYTLIDNAFNAQAASLAAEVAAPASQIAASQITGVAPLTPQTEKLQIGPRYTDRAYSQANRFLHAEP